MAQLVLDAAAIQLAMQKLSGQPIFAGPDGNLLEPGIIDLADDGETSDARWQPGDRRTKFLTLSAEACRDVVFHSEHLLSASARARAIRALVVPACNFVDVTVQLLATLNGAEQRKMRESWPKGDQQTYREAAKRLKKKHSKGPLRAARNKIGAHLDAEAYERPVRVELKDVLGAIGDSLIAFFLALNHESNSFAWIRSLGAAPDTELQVVETMNSYPVAARWLTDSDGRVIDVGILQLAADPRVELQRDALSAVAVYNKLAVLEGAAIPEIRIDMHQGSGEIPRNVRLASASR